MTDADFKKLLKAATLPERTVSIVMDRALVAEFQRAEDALRNAQEKRVGDARLASEVTKAAQVIEDLRERMKASTVEFRFRGMSAGKWRALKAEHPVGDEGTREDMVLGAGVACSVADSRGYYEHVAACPGRFPPLYWRVDSDGTVVFVAASDITHTTGGEYLADSVGLARIVSASRILLQVGSTAVEILPDKIKVAGNVVVDGGLWARDGLRPWETRPV